MLNIVTEMKQWQILRKSLGNKTIGFVPTMGNLHRGHLSLCERSSRDNDITIVSIFVNPTQFNETNDFNNYPRTLEEDTAMLKTIGVDYLLLPDAKEMYPDQYQTQVIETDLSALLEGEHRPGHFNGMLSVVLKLLNLTQAHHAYFGEKDYQQLLLIKKMVAAFFIPTEIIACETVRAEDGLALSSRNSRLNLAERKLAAQFFKLLQGTLSLDDRIASLENLGFKVEYIVEKWQRRLGAVWLGNTRLIDNVPIINC